MTQKSPSFTDQHVSSRIRLRRLQLGLSQEGLARALGITFQQVQKYEKGTNRVSAGRLQEIACALSVPLHFFYEDAPGTGAPVTQDDALRLSRAMASPEIIALVQAVASFKSARVRLIMRDLAIAVAEELAGRSSPTEESHTSINPR